MKLATAYAIRHRPSGRWQENQGQFTDQFNIKNLYETAKAAEAHIRKKTKFFASDPFYANCLLEWQDAEVVELSINL